MVLGWCARARLLQVELRAAEENLAPTREDGLVWSLAMLIGTAQVRAHAAAQRAPMRGLSLPLLSSQASARLALSD